MSDREELERLRKLKRMRELEAKAGSQTQAPNPFMRRAERLSQSFGQPMPQAGQGLPMRGSPAEREAAGKARAQTVGGSLDQRIILAGQGSTFGFGDEVSSAGAAIGAGVAAPFRGQNPIDAGRQAFTENQAYQAEAMRMAREARPVESFGYEMLGGIGTGGGAASAASKAPGAVGTLARSVTEFAPAKNAVGRVAQGSQGGALAGGVYGAGQGNTLEERSQGAMQGLVAGGLVGGAIPGVANALAGPARVAGGQIANAMDAMGLTKEAGRRSAKKFADRRMNAFLESSGMTREDFARKATEFGDKPVTTAEVLGRDAIGAAVALSRKSGGAADFGRAAFQERVTGLPARIDKDFRQVAGIRASAVTGDVKALAAEMRQAAGPAYEKAFAKPFQPTERLVELTSKSPDMQKAMASARAKMQTEDALNPAMPFAGMPSQARVQYWDLVGEALGDEIDRALNTGATRNARRLTDLKKTLQAEIDEAVPEYAEARGLGGDPIRLQEAMDEGVKSTQRKASARDIAETMSKMGSVDTEAFRGGFTRSFVDAIDAGRLSPNEIWAKATQDKFETVFGQKRGLELIRRLRIEADLRQRGVRFNPDLGSVTSQATMGEQVAEGAVGSALDLMTGNFAQAARRAANALFRLGLTEKQADELARRLYSKPNAFLEETMPTARPDISRIGGY